MKWWEKGKRKRQIDRLLRIAAQAYLETGRLEWSETQTLIRQIERLLWKWPLPDGELWREHFPDDARQTAKFLSRPAEISWTFLGRGRPDPERERLLLLDDVLSTWQKQALFVFVNPELLSRPYKERVKS